LLIKTSLPEYGDKSKQTRKQKEIKQQKNNTARIISGYLKDTTY